MDRRLAVVTAVVGALVPVGPAGAVAFSLSRTFVPSRTSDFDALPLGALEAGTVLAPGVVFDGADPPLVMGVAATVVATGAEDRALTLGPGETAGFTFRPPVTAVGVSVEEVVEGPHVSVVALDASGAEILGYGYVYPVGEPMRFPEVTEATSPPITTFLVTAVGGVYRVDDLDLLPEPAPGGAALLALAALARRGRLRAPALPPRRPTAMLAPSLPRPERTPS